MVGVVVVVLVGLIVLETISIISEALFTRACAKDKQAFLRRLAEEDLLVKQQAIENDRLWYEAGGLRD